MAHSNPEEKEELDIWEAFDDAVERAERSLKRARENYELIRQTGEPLPEVYSSALAEIAEATQAFDSVYEVTDEELERAETVATRAEFLVAVTDAYREYHEAVISRRVAIAGEWFDTLNVNVEEAAADVAADQSTLARQIRALRKLTDAEKYGQLQSSDRIDLDAIEADIQRFDDAVREAMPADEYVQFGLKLAESFHDQYTEDLSALNREGVDRDAITITDHVNDVPETEPIATRLERGDVTDDDVAAVGTTVATYAEVARLTKKRRARYELGEELLSAVEDSPLVDDADLVADLRPRLTSFELRPIEERVAGLIEGKATISETERLLQLLSEHNGSVRQTAPVLDRSTEKLFDHLHDLFVQEEIADLEVQFE